MAVKLGSVVTDSITGFSGVAMSRTEFIHGCARVYVQPKALHDGKPVEAQYFDELQLVENVVEPTDKKKGGPGDCASRPNGSPQRSAPVR